MLKKCFTCSIKLRNSDKINIFTAETSESHTAPYKLLENFIGHEISIDDAFICRDCFLKLNEYDIAFCIMQKIRNEFLQVLRQNSTTTSVKNNNTVAEIIDKGENTIKIEFEGESNYKTNIELFELEEDGVTFLVEAATDTHSEMEDENSGDILEVQFLDENDDIWKEQSSIDEIEFEEYNKRNILKLNESPNNSVNDTKIILSGISNEKRENACKICNASFITSKELDSHRKEMHANRNKFVCYVCGVSYKKQSVLNVHIAMHKGESPFKCEVCGKNFTQKGGLKRHMPMHTGEKPFQCDKCGKQFIHYSSFHMHNLAHSDIRKVKCEICGLQLRSTSHLNRHLLVHTGAKPHSCPKCGQRFAQRYNMMSHLRTSHQGIRRKKRDLNKSILSNKNSIFNNEAHHPRDEYNSKNYNVIDFDLNV